MSIFLGVLIVGFFIWLNYATKADDDFAVYSHGFENHSVSVYDLTNGLYDAALVRMDEYAKLSDIVYRDGETASIDNFGGWRHLSIDMEDISPPDEERKTLGGFYYEIWALEEAEKTTVAIVFQGTDQLIDWLANIRWVRRIFYRATWDHYDQLGKIADTIVDTIESRFPNVNRLEIVATGHSLGGGLAQFMAYANPAVKHVYAFNSSPVTGYYDVDKAKRNRNKQGVVVYRINESGEGLSFPRKIFTVLYPVPLFITENSKIVRIRFSFSTGADFITQHKMEDLANNLLNYKKDKSFSLKK